MSSHNDGSIELLTGKTPTVADPTSTARSEHPDFGMITSRVRGRHVEGLPQYIGIPRQPFMTQPVYLGVSHSAFAAGDPSKADYRPANLTLHAGVDGSRLADRRGLLGQFDRYRRELDADGTIKSWVIASRPSRNVRSARTVSVTGSRRRRVRGPLSPIGSGGERIQA